MMIESCYWKEELHRIAKAIKPRRKAARWSERNLCIVERDLMIGFFIVRRLIELHKVSSKTREFQLDLFACPRTSKPRKISGLNNLWELYDLNKEKRERKKPMYVSNQFIHAQISNIARDETRNWSDVYIVSDFDRKNCIWRVSLEQIRLLFLTAADDYPHSIQFRGTGKDDEVEIVTN
jgi:hypothetical protein